MAAEKKGFVAGLKSRLTSSKTAGDDDEDGEEQTEKVSFMKTGMNMMAKMSKIAHGDGDEEEGGEYVKKDSFHIDDGPPAEALKWTDAEYELDKKMPEMWRDFQQPRDWWLSAEEALPILAAERNQIREDAGGKPNFVTAGLLATNRFLAEQIKNITDANKKEPPKFRDGLDAILHVLPPDSQRVCKAARDGDEAVLKSLLRFEIDLDTSDQFGTPLHYAAAFGKLKPAVWVWSFAAAFGKLKVPSHYP
ncbi:hypothetical protein T484DRAFT_1824888 [Baffinella frigidus]|nr:hypothetical protein T484DRAFT_1824888 [Cryptophyta sp. CCMP2293]